MRYLLFIFFYCLHVESYAQNTKDTGLIKLPAIESITLGMTTQSYYKLDLRSFELETSNHQWFFELTPNFYYNYLSQLKINLRDYLFSVNPSEITDLYTMKYGKPNRYTKKDSASIIDHSHYGKNFTLTSTTIYAEWKFYYYDIIIECKYDDYYQEILEGSFAITYKCNDDYYTLIDNIISKEKKLIMEKSKKRI